MLRRQVAEGGGNNYSSRSVTSSNLEARQSFPLPLTSSRSSKMSLQSILLTGTTGNVGAILLEHLLEGGTTVNAVLRSFANSKEFIEQKYPHEVATGKLRFTEIPDMGVEGVFDAPAKDVTAIIHVATPLSNSDFKAKMIEPAWQIDLNILEAANRSSTVKRVIVTGSIVAVMKLPEDLLKDETFNEENYNPVTLEEAVTNVSSAYQYSKVSSELKAWEYMAKEDRSFDLVLLLAPSITGRSIQQGFKATKDGMGGMSSIYKNLFDRDAVGSIFPFVMYASYIFYVDRINR